MIKEKKRKQKTIDFRHEELPIIEKNAIRAGFVTKTGKARLGAYLVSLGLAGEGIPTRVKGADAILNLFKTIREASISVESHSEVLGHIKTYFKNMAEEDKRNSAYQYADESLYKCAKSNKELEDILAQTIHQFKILNNNLEELMER